jgi:hypothetical protein
VIKSIREELGEKLFSGSYMSTKTMSKLAQKMDTEFPLYVESFLEIIHGINGMLAKLAYPIMTREQKLKYVSDYLNVAEHRIAGSPRNEDLMAFLSHEVILDVLEETYKHMKQLYSLSTDEFIVLWIALVQTGKVEEVANKHWDAVTKQAK